VETLDRPITLRQLPIGARILVRARKDWRTAVVSFHGEEKTTLIVCSPSGRTYRLYRTLETELVFEGTIALLKIEGQENWRDNFSKYDVRW